VRAADDERAVIKMLTDLGVEPDNIMLDDFGG
jgi:Na+-transporting NADH:ubiquinone oxidoreductase subunit NqrF